MPKNNPTSSEAVPAAVPPKVVAQLKSGARKAAPGAVENLLAKQGIPSEAWIDVLLWLIREQGEEIGHQWQLVWALANRLDDQDEEPPRSVPLEDAVWLLERLGEQLAFRGKDAVFHGAALLLPGWDWALDRLVMRSFLGRADRLRAVTVHPTYRLGLLYARGQLGDALTEQEQDEVLYALATTYVTVQGQLSALVPADGALVLYDDINFDNDDVDDDWAQLWRPFATAEGWSRAIGQAAAAVARIESEWERPTIHVDRVLRHRETCTPEELAVVLGFGYVDEGRCDGELAELAARYLGELSAEQKRAALASVREVASATEQELPREVSDALMPSGAERVQALEELAARAALPRDVRIYVPLRGETSLNGVGEIAPGAYTDEVPELDEEPMEPLLTLDLAEVPELKERFGSDAVVFFLSALASNEAHELDSGEVVVKPVTLEQARDYSEGTPFRLVPLDVPKAAFDPDPPAELQELADQLNALPARVLGPPLFIQDEGRTEGFVMQLSEDFVEANFGGGVMYLYDDDGFWQS